MLHVLSADYLGDYALLCTFDNGESRKVDLKPLLEFPAFHDLRDEAKFL